MKRFRLALRCFWAVLRHGRVPLQLQGYVMDLTVPQTPHLITAPQNSEKIQVLFNEAGKAHLVYRGNDVRLAKRVIAQGRHLIDSDSSSVTGVRVYKGDTPRGSWGSWSPPLSLSGG